MLFSRFTHWGRARALIGFSIIALAAGSVAPAHAQIGTFSGGAVTNSPLVGGEYSCTSLAGGCSNPSGIGSNDSINAGTTCANAAICTGFVSAVVGNGFGRFYSPTVNTAIFNPGSCSGSVCDGGTGIAAGRGGFGSVSGQGTKLPASYTIYYSDNDSVGMQADYVQITVCVVPYSLGGPVCGEGQIGILATINESFTCYNCVEVSGSGQGISFGPDANFLRQIKFPVH